MKPGGLPTQRIQEPVSAHAASGQALRGDLSYPGAPGLFTLLFVHGFASNRNGEKALALESACAECGLTLARFDCRGHGNSDGSLRDFRPSHLIEDLSAMHAFLRGRGCERIYLVGSSMGGFASAWFALQCLDVPACVFMAPAFRFLERRSSAFDDARLEHWRTTGVTRFKNQWIDVEVGYGMVEEAATFPFHELASRWTKPALLFHGMADDTVPVADPIDFIHSAARAPIELRLFKTADHRLSEIKDEIARETCRFVMRLENPALPGHASY